MYYDQNKTWFNPDKYLDIRIERIGDRMVRESKDPFEIRWYLDACDDITGTPTGPRD